MGSAENLMGVLDRRDKEALIKLLIEKGALQFGDFKLKSGRISPWFFNSGNLDDGKSLQLIGREFARIINDMDVDVDVVYGPAYKAIPLAAATAGAMADYGADVGYVFDRKEAKDHGDAKDEQSNWLIGRRLSPGNSVVMVDDVLTTAKTKYDALSLVNRVAPGVKFTGLVFIVDRQELSGGVELKGDEVVATENFTRETGIPARGSVNAIDVYRHLRDNSNPNCDRVRDYLLKYGSNEVREAVRYDGKNNKRE